MNAEARYQQLKDLAERLNITVSEENLRKAGIRSIRSGLCRVKNRYVYLMDKHRRLDEKIDLLTSCLAGMDLEDVHMVPALREWIESRRKRGTKSPRRKRPEAGPPPEKNETASS